VRGKTAFDFVDLGERTLKNVERPVRIYVARASAEAAPISAAALKSLLDTGKPLALPDKPSIAVLPFESMSGEATHEYFADGVVEDIITALSKFKSLFVIARNSSFTYKGRAVDIKQVGRELGVRYVLEGSMRKSGDKVRITGQLIEAATGSQLWADRIDGALEHVFELQDEVTAGHRRKRAVSYLERALRMSPRDPEIGDMFSGIAIAHQVAGRDRESYFAQKTLDDIPWFTVGYRTEIVCLVHLGLLDEAKALATYFLQNMDPGFTVGGRLPVFRDKAFERSYHGALIDEGLPA
jgi:TolB-like protein